jgi:hypothetical protein
VIAHNRDADAIQRTHELIDGPGVKPQSTKQAAATKVGRLLKVQVQRISLRRFLIRGRLRKAAQDRTLDLA